MSKRLTVDLTLLKKVVLELEASLANAEAITDDNEYFIAMSKAAGVAYGAVQEATALIADIYTAMQQSNKTAAATDKATLLSSLLGKGWRRIRWLRRRKLTTINNKGRPTCIQQPKMTSRRSQHKSKPSPIKSKPSLPMAPTTSPLPMS